jgi:type II secretory pathway component PulF
MWYRNLLSDLASLLHAGMPIREALQNIASGKTGPGARLAGRLAESLGGGSTLGDAMACVPAEIPVEHVALVRAGECAGRLEEVLRRITARIDEDRRAAAELYQAVAWPVLTAVAAVVLLPLYLVIMGHWIQYLVLQLAVFGPLVFLGALFFWYLPRLPSNCAARDAIESVLFRIPWIRRILVQRALARAFGVLGILIEVGGSLDDAFGLAAAAVTWRALRSGLQSVPAELRRGRKLHEALRSAPGLSLEPDWISRIQVGETAGAMDRIFNELGEDLEGRVLVTVRRVGKVLPVVITITVGVFVLCRALQVLGSLRGVV